MKLNYYWSQEYQILLNKENKRIGYEWESLKDPTDQKVNELIDRQTKRHQSIFKRFEA